MRLVYHAHNLVDAHLALGLLRFHGIEANLQGQWLVGGLGELPLDQGIAVVVPEDGDRVLAERLLVEWQAADNHESLPQWRCRHCYAFVDGCFGCCWRCGKDS